MSTKSPKTTEEEPDRFLKIMQYQSWIFLVALIIDVIYILIKGLASGNGVFGGLGFYSLVFALISMIGTGLSFGLIYQIQAYPARKKSLFTTYYVSLALIGIIAVLVLAAYQWQNPVNFFNLVIGMPQNLRNLKGTRDLDVKEKLIQNTIVRAFSEEFEKYGYNPLETPIVEFQEILASKYAGGAEILKEMYVFQDNGKRELGLRYDLTVPFSRYVGMNPDLKLPFKRYEFGKVFRDGPIKIGRYREFFQLDADLVGSESLLYDAECIAIVLGAASKLGFEIFIELNSRKLLFGILREIGIISDDLASKVILSIDKLKKIGMKGVQDELVEKGIGITTCEQIFKKIQVKGSNQKKIQFFEENLTDSLALEGLSEVKTILSYCKEMKIAGKVKFRPELARGLEIYTGPVFEAFFKKSTITSSIAAGGRYDKIIGKFIDRDRIYPAVGISIGVDVILTEILQNPEKYPKIQQKETSVDVLLIPVKISTDKLIPIMTKLRNAGIKCDFSDSRNIRDSLGFASSLGIPICLILGKRELDEQIITLKNMVDGSQTPVKISSLLNSVQELLSTL